jgi:hypothetical protein
MSVTGKRIEQAPSRDNIQIVGLEFLVEVDGRTCWTEIQGRTGRQLGRHQRIMSVSNEVLVKMLKAALRAASKLVASEGGVRIWIDGGSPVFADGACLLDVQALDRDGKRGWRVIEVSDEAPTSADSSAQLRLSL